MFAKLHHHHQYQPQHHHQLNLDPQISEEEEEEGSRSSGGGARSISKRPKPDPDSGGGGGGGGEEGTIEVAKRPRGRPPGSKNKPKPPLIITRDTECAMRPLFLELPGGVDVIEAIARFTHRRNIGLTVLTASGSVGNVSFRQSTMNATTNGGGGAAIVTFHGRFEILSISATFLPPSLPITSSTSTSSPTVLPSSFMISLVGSQGQIIGGSVAGSLVTAGTVFIVAASFDNPSYHRLPITEDDQDLPPNSTSEENHESTTTSNNQLVESCNMSMYHHVPVPVPPSDLIWTPTPRPPPPF
ncbi:hypothetical protein ACHQM5_024113 [Ranunculus cassubicifolius]